MAKVRLGFRTLAAMTFLAGSASSGIAAPTVEQILQYAPRQAGIEFSSPTAAERSACTVDLEKGKLLPGGKQATAWVLKDGAGRVLRKFHDTTGENRVNQWSYYRDGEEAYREIDTNANQKADQFRWLGPNGSKWGVDKDEDGRIDHWLIISAEEASQEVLASVINRDFNRLQALMLNKDDIDALGLPEAESARIREKLAGAGQQFQKTCAELIKLDAKSQWIHLETKLPQTVAADVLGSKSDLVRYRHATILYQDGSSKENAHNWLQTGELIQVGRAWKIVQAPVPGVHVDTPVRADGAGAGTEFSIPTGAEALIEELKKLDANPPKSPQEAVGYYMARAATLEKIVGLIRPGDKKHDPAVWVRQIAEAYASAHQNGGPQALPRLQQWQDTVVKQQAGTALAGYITFRVISAQYTLDLQRAQNDRNFKPEDMQKLQDSWRDKLAKFTSDFPSAEDTPDALMQLGMVNEFVGKESEAKNWYGLLVKNFDKHPLAKKAQGCLDRINLEGKEFVLVAPTLGSSAPFDIATLRGKAVVVYYWASWNGSAVNDFAKIKLAMAPYADKVQLVCVNLDNAAGDALAFVKTNAIGGIHVHQVGGLTNALANQYGINVLPQMFLVEPNGKVASRSVQANTLEDELKKVLKDRNAKQ